MPHFSNLRLVWVWTLGPDQQKRGIHVFDSNLKEIKSQTSRYMWNRSMLYALLRLLSKVPALQKSHQLSREYLWNAIID